MTEPRRKADPSAGQPTRQTVGRRERLGGWHVDRAGNPVARWSDSSELALDDNKVGLSHRIARLLEERAEATWHKSDCFRRLKACGVDKACIVSEQETPMRRYREGLPAGGW